MVSVTLRRLAAACLLSLVGLTAQAQVGQWVYKAHMITPRHDACGALGQDGKIYVFGGEAGSGVLNSAERYDPTTDTWSGISSLPYGVSGASAVALPDGRILIVGGFTTFLTDEVLAYDPATDTYAYLATIPTVSNYNAAALGKDGDLVVIQTSSSKPAIVYSYSLSTGIWSTLSTFSQLKPGPGLGSSSSGPIYALGGHNITAVNQAFAFDSHADAWTTLPHLIETRDTPGVVEAGDGRIYAIGGFDIQTTSSSVEAFDPDFNRWELLPHMNNARGSAVCVADSQGRVYAIGGGYQVGSQGLTTWDSVESYEPSKLFGYGKDANADEGTAFNGDVAAFKDADTSQTPVSFVASIDWGDGTSSTGSVSPGSKATLYKVTGTHTYTKAGNFTTTIKVDDSDGESMTLTGKVTVNNPPILITPQTVNSSAAVPFSGVLGTFTDQNPLATESEYKLVINWGDATPYTDGVVTTNSAGGFFLKGGPHTYASPGTYNMQLFLTDGDNFTLLGSNTAKVGNAPATVTGATVNAVEGNQFSGTVASFTHPNTSLTAGDFTASVTWGDGSVTPGNVVSDGQGGYLVKGAHTYMDEGSYPVSVSVTLTSGPTGQGSGSANVADAPLTANGFTLLIKNRSFSDTVAFFTDGNPYGTAGEFQAAIFWGDGKSSVGTVVAAGAGFKVKGSHVYSKKAKYTVTISIKDNGGSTATATTYINALNAK